MAERTDRYKREQWLIRNTTDGILSIGDLDVPTIEPHRTIDLLLYTDKNTISQSTNLGELLDAGWLTLNKRKDSSAKNVNRTAAKSSVQTTEENELTEHAATRVTHGASGNIVGVTDLLSSVTTNELILGVSPVRNVTASGGIVATHSTMKVQGSGGPVIITANPQIAAGVNGEILILEGQSSTNTITLNDGNGIHIHGQAILREHDIILMHYSSALGAWAEISRNFQSSEKAWAISQTTGAGTHYIGGYYDFAATHNDFDPAATFGTAEASYAAHFFVVLGALTVDELTLRVTGTSITDLGVRATGDTQDIVIPDVTAADTYFETSKKWLGQVSISVVSGTAQDCNYGWCKYWDNNNNNFLVQGIEVTWTCGINDANANILLRHHRDTGWTYNAGATPTPPAALADMNTDHGGTGEEIELINGERGAWKRSNLATTVEGGDSEGTIIELVTTNAAGRTFEIGNVMMRIITK